MKVFLTVIITAAVTAGLLVGVGAWVSGRAAKGAQATKVRLQSPTRGELVEIVSAPGQIIPKTKVSLSARISARIVELPKAAGDRVAVGDLLVRLDEADLRAALDSAKARRNAQAVEKLRTGVSITAAEAAIRSVKAQLDDAKRELARQERLHASGDVSQADLDKTCCHVEELLAGHVTATTDLQARKLTLQALDHRLQAADAEIAQAEEKLRHTRIASPIDGVITRLNAEVGELVVTGTMNNPGTVILEVADMSRMLVVSDIDEADVGSVSRGQRVSVRVRAHPHEEFAGTVESIALASSQGIRQISDFQSKQFRVEILLAPTDKQLYSGMSAEVDIQTRHHENVLKIPSQAVLGRRVDELPAEVRENNANIDEKKTFAIVTYRYNDGKALATPVKVGPSDDTHTIILAGLDEADQIIVGPYKVLEKLKHEQNVKDEREEKQTTTPLATKPAD